jgi:uncharacterized membrane protein YebE (DUF533 family)
MKKENPMSMKKILGRTVLAASLLAMTGCANMDAQQQTILSGGAAGAVIGTLGTVITGGCIPCGTAIGGAVGAGAGYLMYQLDQNTKSSAPSSAPK